MVDILHLFLIGNVLNSKILHESYEKSLYVFLVESTNDFLKSVFHPVKQVGVFEN